MLRKTILSCITAVVLLGNSTVKAKDRTHIETFISHVKETNNLVTVSELWAGDNNYDKAKLDKEFKKSQPLTLDYAKLASFLQKKSFAITLVLPGADGKTYTLDLAQYQVLSNDFELHEMGANNVDTKVDYTPGLYYRGVVRGEEGSIAAFSFFNNQIYGIFSTPGAGNFVVSPNGYEGSEFNNEHYILFNDDDIIDKSGAPKCFTEDLEDFSYYSTANKTTTTPNNKVYGSPQCKQVRWFHVVDYFMFTRKGTTNSANYVTALMNADGALFMNEGLAIQSKYVQVNTATDAYQSLPTGGGDTDLWLEKFGQVTQNTLYGCDLAFLLTSKGTNMGGIAWLSALCRSYAGAPSYFGPYAFCKVDNTTSATPAYSSGGIYSWDVGATTHEMGHNLSSRHTHACVWGPTRTTAIDGCADTEPRASGIPACSDPGNPTSSVKGTIMSYCHLLSVGINLSNGFGPQPGDTVRYLVSNSSSFCGSVYKPNVALAKAGRTVTADRECTDMATGITYYWKSNSNINNDDDTLVLLLKKNGNNIGNLNSTGFSVSSTTLTGYGGGTGLNKNFPVGTLGAGTVGKNYFARRYWQIKHTGSATLSTAVDVGFPMLAADTTDVNGSVPGPTAPFNNFRMYTVKKATINPNPDSSFVGALSSDISVYTKASTASTNNWTTFSVASAATMVAYLKTTTLNGGGAFYVNGFGVGLPDNIDVAEGITIFPNPTNGNWNVSLTDNFADATFIQLFSADGRVVAHQELKSGSVNTINAQALPTGMYFYRVVSGAKLYTGNLIKN